MRTFTPETAVDVIELQQLVVDWGHELDQGCLNVTQYFTEDCFVDMGALSYTGHAAMKKFYDDRNARVLTQQKDGIRTQRHGIASLRILVDSKDRARATFLIINFSGGGKPPLLNGTTPSIVTDVLFEFRRDTGHPWRISSFIGKPQFLGNDPFLSGGVVPKS